MISSLRAAALSLALGAAALAAQQPQGNSSTGPSTSRSVLTEADFARIEQLGATALSPDGKWIAYDFRRGVSGPSELRYRPVAGGTEATAPLGSTPVFSANSRWLLFTVTADTTGARAGGAGRRGGTQGRAGNTTATEPARNRVGIVDLRSGATTMLQDVQSFALSKDGAHVALRRYASGDARTRGADLIVRDLEQRTDRSEERRVGKECRTRWSAEQYKKT